MNKAHSNLSRPILINKKPVNTLKDDSTYLKLYTYWLVRKWLIGTFDEPDNILWLIILSAIF